MESFIFNFTSDNDQIDGDFIVVPTTMIVPGVLNGSQGPLLYTPEEIANSLGSWDNIPILINHPPKGKSAADVIKFQEVGRISNSHIDNGRLRADLRLDTNALNRIRPELLVAINNHKQIEVSTGLNTQNEDVGEGAVHNDPIKGEIPYVAIARNFRPDHLAILPNAIGACSIDDGCGVNNKLSDTDVRTALRVLLQEANAGQDVWIEELFVNEVVYSLPTGELLRSKYKRAKDKVTLSDAFPEKVQRITTFKVISNLDGQIGSSARNSKEGDDSMPKKMTDKVRKEMVDGLISNSCCWEEEHRTELEAMPDNQLTLVKNAADKQAETEELLTAAESGFNSDTVDVVFNREKREWEHTVKTPEGKEKPVDNETKNPKQLTDEEWLEAAPESVRNTLKHAEGIAQRERETLVSRIVTNISDDVKPEKVILLANKSLEDLEEIASLMPQPEPQTNYFGGQPAELRPVENIDREDKLEDTEIDWTENSVFAKE